MSKFKVRRSVPTVRLTGTQSLVTSGVNYVSTNPPQWITTPAPVFHEGYPNQQFDLGAYIYNYNQTTDSFSLAPGSVQLPSWLTFSGSNSRFLTANGTQVDASDFTGLVIRVTRAGLFSNSQPISVSVTDAVAFTLTSQLGGSDLPWAFGHAFRQGDISTGQSVVVSGANSYQCSIKTTWPDGSAKFAVLSGKADFTAGVAKVLSLVSGTASSGTTLTTTHLQATGITAEFDAGAYGTATFSNADFSSFAYLWVSGHVMSSWTFRKVFSGDSDLVAWMEVRLYQGGAVEVLPWVENGFMTGSTCANKSATYTFTLGGTQRFSSSIDVKHHTRIPLVTGSVFAYWLGTDPQITPAHNRAYLMSTKLVPNYGWTSPSESTLNALQQTYTPNTLAGVNSSMGDAGGSGSIIPDYQAFYVTSNGDVRAYRAMVIRGLSGGSWSIHYRDPSTHSIPKMSSYPSISLQGGTPTIQSGTGGEVLDSIPVTTHQPSFGYLPHLTTGWWWFWEESAHWAWWNYTKATPEQRRGQYGVSSSSYLYSTGDAGVCDTRNGTYPNRGASWSLNVLTQTLTLCPSSHSTYSDWLNAWEKNTEYYYKGYVSNEINLVWTGLMGVLGDYGTSAQGSVTHNIGVGSGFMTNYQTLVWGFSSDIGLPQSSTSRTRHEAVRNLAYTQIVGRCGTNSTWNWRRFAVFGQPYAEPYNTFPPTTFYNHTQSYQALLTVYGLASISDTAGLTLKNHSSDTDMGSSGSTFDDYLPTAVGSLALAVDHGAPGASAGWLLISGASNFPSSASNWNAKPQATFKPRIPPTALPAWLTTQPLWEWFQISGTSLSSAVPSPIPSVIYASGGPQSMIEAWNGAGLRRSDSLYIIGCAGGHNDWTGNDIYTLNLEAGSPSWSQRQAWTNPSVPGNHIYDRSPYYADVSQPSGYAGASPHQYWSAHFINTQNRFVLFRNNGPFDSPAEEVPGGWPFASPGGRFNTAYNFSTNVWDAPGTVADYPVSGLTSTAVQGCSDPETGDFYIGVSGGGFRKWTAATNSWSLLSSTSIRDYAGSAVDFTRGRILCVGDFNGVLDPIVRGTDGSVISPTFGGLGASVLRISGYPCVSYDEENDAFMVFTNNNPMTVYRVDPSTWVVDQPTITGTAPAARISGGVNNSVQYVPNLKGFVWANRYSGNVYFLRTAS